MDSNLAAYAAYEAEKRRQAEQQQQNQPNLVDALGKLALGAGAVAAGAYGLRRMLPTAAKQVAQAPAEAAAVRRVAGAVPAEVARQQELQSFTRAARAERPRGVVQTNLSKLQDEIAAAERVLQDPEMLALVKQQQQQERSEALSFQSKAQAEYRNLLSQKADEVISAVRKEENTSQAAAQGDFARQYLSERNYVEPSMVAQHQAAIPENVEHAVNAVNSAQDQEAARAARAAVRDVIGTDLGAVNARAEQLEGQYQAVAERTGATPPVDAAMTQAVQEATGEAVIDQAELDLAKISEYQQSRQAQIESTMARGLSRARAERNVQMTPSQQAAMERVLPSYSAEDIMSRPGLQIVESEGAPSVLRQEPAAAPLGKMVSPASKTSYRGITGRPDLGIYGEVPSGKRGYVEFGPGPVEVSKVIINEGEERGITTPRRFEPGYNLAKQETPEGFVYTEEAMQRPTAGTSKTGLENVGDEVVGMMTMAGDPTQRESARAELARRDPEYLEQRVEAGKAGETVRRIMSSGRPDAQKLVNEYLTQLRQQQG